MARQLIAGNWKMNLNRQQAVQLAGAVVAGASTVTGVDLVVCPPSVYLSAVAGSLTGSPVAILL